MSYALICASISILLGLMAQKSFATKVHY